MDDEHGSMISIAAAESTGISFPLVKPCRLETSSSSLARLKGVVQQQNGHWGAQIYASHQRIWLGTFKSEKSAALAYDRAAIKLRLSDDLHLNTPWTDLTTYELSFQDLYATDAVLGMIRDGSYEPKFNEFMRAIGKVRADDAVAVPASDRVDGEGITLHELFQKELTPSDVGKLNRLVIPKKHAVKYFPYIQVGADKEGEAEGVKEPESGAAEGLMLPFKDRLDRLWEFRYCYWKSSQSFVFTKGWNKFVKTNNLRAKDTVTFYRCEDREGLKRPFCVIDVGHYSGADVIKEGGFGGYIGMSLGLGLGYGGSRYEHAASVGITRREEEEQEEGEIVEDPVLGRGEKKAVWLFGAKIS